jgi:hypothetical protein
MNSINRKLIGDCLKELSDRGLQERVWMSSGPPEVSSFTEAVEQLFTDSGLEDALHSGKTGFGREAELVLLELEKQLGNVNTRLGAALIISDPAMRRVRELASSALGLIQKS